MRLATIILISFWSTFIFGQDSVLLTKNFTFEDGIYFSFNALQNNQPDHKWEEVTATYFTNPTTLLAEVQEIKFNESESLLSFKKVYAICINGIPYLKLKNQEESFMTKFAGLKVRGVLGYFSYSISKMEKIKIQAYNPLNGQPFRTGFVEKEKSLKIEKVLSWQDGNVHDFDQASMKKLVSDDKPLLTSIKELKDWELEEKLFKCLLIYNDRHSIYVPKRSL